MNKIETVYIAGPMRGYPEYNFPAFHAAEKTLKAMGFKVFSPARHDEENGFNSKGLTGNEDLSTLGFNLREALAWDLNVISTEVDGVVVLPGWEKSSGTAAELATAKALGLPIQTLDGKDIHVGRLTTDVAEHLKPVDPNPKDLVGSGKVPMGLVSDLAIAEESLAMTEGASKYGAFNYRSVPVRSSIYIDAAKRHIAKWFNGEDRDPLTGVHHLGSARACFGILIDAEAMGKLIDDRPPANPEVGKRIDEMSSRVKHLRNMFKDYTPHHYTIADK